MPVTVIAARRLRTSPSVVAYSAARAQSAQVMDRGGYTLPLTLLPSSSLSSGQAARPPEG